ncbi:MAG: isoprenylcysteine carboxylmethyltransferase family protein [Candidatus Thorarchaeota archaeon]|nr:isoprenylcysteine carboxylmethyltransferase family protein [Candidatus Thorarchaeota archaeon]
MSEDQHSDEFGPYTVLRSAAVIANFIILLPAALSTRSHGTSFLDFVSILIGIWLASRFVRYLGRAHEYPAAWTSPSRVRQIERRGIFSKIRHPTIAAVIYMNLAYLFLFRSMTILLTVCLCIGFWYMIAKYEESVMNERFGDQYREYIMRTGMFLAGDGHQEMY